MEKDFDKWNKKKKDIHKSVFSDFVHTREVWWCSLGVNIGFEQDGKHNFFERPVLIIKKFNRDVVLIAPITSQVKHNKYYVTFIHNDEQYSVIISQLRLLSTKRLRRKLYIMNSDLFTRVRQSIKEMI